MALPERNKKGSNMRLTMMYKKTNGVSVFRQIVTGAIQLKHKELGRTQEFRSGIKTWLTMMYQKTNGVSVFRQTVTGANYFRYKELGRVQKTDQGSTHCLP
jgi:hypothetical protein